MSDKVDQRSINLDDFMDEADFDDQGDAGEDSIVEQQKYFGEAVEKSKSRKSCRSRNMEDFDDLLVEEVHPLNTLMGRLRELVEGEDSVGEANRRRVGELEREVKALLRGGDGEALRVQKVEMVLDSLELGLEQNCARVGDRISVVLGQQLGDARRQVATMQAELDAIRRSITRNSQVTGIARKIDLVSSTVAKWQQVVSDCKQKENQLTELKKQEQVVTVTQPVSPFDVQLFDQIEHRVSRSNQGPLTLTQGPLVHTQGPLTLTQGPLEHNDRELYRSACLRTSITLLDHPGIRVDATYKPGVPLRIQLAYATSSKVAAQLQVVVLTQDVSNLDIDHAIDDRAFHGQLTQTIQVTHFNHNKFITFKLFHKPLNQDANTFLVKVPVPFLYFWKNSYISAKQFQELYSNSNGNITRRTFDLNPFFRTGIQELTLAIPWMLNCHHFIAGKTNIQNHSYLIKIYQTNFNHEIEVKELSEGGPSEQLLDQMIQILSI